MKRSDMLHFMCESLFKSEDLDECSSDTVERMLSLQEKLGMLPPYEEDGFLNLGVWQHEED